MECAEDHEREEDSGLLGARDARRGEHAAGWRTDARSSTPDVVIPSRSGRGTIETSRSPGGDDRSTRRTIRPPAERVRLRPSGIRSLGAEYAHLPGSVAAHPAAVRSPAPADDRPPCPFVRPGRGDRGLRGPDGRPAFLTLDSYSQADAAASRMDARTPGCSLTRKDDAPTGKSRPLRDPYARPGGPAAPSPGWYVRPARRTTASPPDDVRRKTRTAALLSDSDAWPEFRTPARKHGWRRLRIVRVLAGRPLASLQLGCALNSLRFLS
jgi:hypothetical protein